MNTMFGRLAGDWAADGKAAARITATPTRWRSMTLSSRLSIYQSLFLSPRASMPAEEPDYQRRVSGELVTRFLPGTAIEIIRERTTRLPPRYALFDFDGTLSLIREGWPE